MSTPIAYFAHPVGFGPTRMVNVRRAKLWIRVLVEVQNRCAIAAPWLPYVEVLDEETHRERGIRDDLACLARCDFLIAAGGVWSPGMVDEASIMRDCESPVVDLTELPADPLSLTPAMRLSIASSVLAAVRELEGDARG